jgi:hypothetical protein
MSVRGSRGLPTAWAAAQAARQFSSPQYEDLIHCVDPQPRI